MPIIDDENLSSKMPKYFRSVLINEEQILILGGLDVEKGISSSFAFLINSGKLSSVESMFMPR